MEYVLYDYLKFRAKWRMFMTQIKLFGVYYFKEKIARNDINSSFKDLFRKIEIIYGIRK